MTGSKQKNLNLDDIKESDFNSVNQVQYTTDTDSFKKVESSFSNALNKESIERVFKYDGDVEGKGFLDEISILCHKGKFDKALNQLKTGNRNYTNNPIFWNVVGTCYSMQGERRKALLFYNKALSLKKNYAPAYNNLGVMYLKEQDYSRALVAFKKAKKLNQFSKTPRYNLAHLYLNFGLYDHAISNATAILTENKKDVDVLNFLGTAFLMQGNYQESLSYFNEIDSDFYEEPSIGINFALAKFLGGEKEEGRDFLEDVESKKMSRSWKIYLKSVKKYMGVK